ncbi:hypothetical protein G7085_10940 [Tessaracoccus sp. HDW20]|uniref:hypothetical protein n=1 Tax=Tessaracoccus coleopterorum TaxID=2714950 RepID=UPI0018D4462B|nr:hypothetical protein [Tessaracoccus coleopterorum]NHB84951.1 hypothetical protein [Tessaracoccus coleopterorum]
MNDPIDPEFLAAMEAAGVTHRPGMGAELMEELRPLLAADGIDLDAIDVDIDTFNEAMTRAIERRNMELSTPTGDDRVAALDVLAAFTLLAHGGHTDDALDLIDKVGPYPSTAFPSVSQVIGTALGLLDTWLAEPPPFHVFYLPYPSYGRRPAGDILAAAGDGAPTPP